MKKELKIYIDKAKLDKSFEFIEDTKIRESLYLFFGYVFMNFDEIDNEITERKLKKIKAHTILIYIGSIIEYITRYFVEQKLTDEKSKKRYLKIKDLKILCSIDEVQICKYETKEISLDDVQNFRALVNGLSDNHLLNEKIINKIDYCRKMRNLVHINMFSISESELINELDKIFTYTKEIIDEIKKKLK